MNQQINEYLEEYFTHLKFKNCTKASIKAYKYDLNNIFNETNPNKGINELKLQDLRLAVYKLCESCKPITIRRRISALKSFYQFLEISDYISKNITRGLDKPKMSQETKDVLSSEEIKKIIEYYPRHYNAKISELSQDHEKLKMIYKKRLFKWSLLIQILFHTMARISEVLKIQYKDIKVDTKHLVLHGKGQKDRIVPLPDGFEILPFVDKNEYLFAKENGEPYQSSRYLQLKIQRLGKELDIENLSPHKFRRTAATIARGNGLDIEILSKIMGHSSIATTITYYLKINNENLNEFKEKIKGNFN